MHKSRGWRLISLWSSFLTALINGGSRGLMFQEWQCNRYSCPLVPLFPCRIRFFYLLTFAQPSENRFELNQFMLRQNRWQQAFYPGCPFFSLTVEQHHIWEWWLQLNISFLGNINSVKNWDLIHRNFPKSCKCLEYESGAISVPQFQD